MLAVAGDSAAGKTTITAGLVDALGPGRCVSISADDYHRFDRAERRDKPFTPLHPDCNYIDILEQHLQLLATGQPILKPVYDHSTGRRVRPELVEPNDFIIVHGLLPLYSKLARAEHLLGVGQLDGEAEDPVLARCRPGGQRHQAGRRG